MNPAWITRIGCRIRTVAFGPETPRKQTVPVDFASAHRARRVTIMSADALVSVTVRPVRDVDAEALGRVHAKCWHETYDHLISTATLEAVSPKRLAELWTHWASQGPEYRMSAALVDGEIVGFVGSGPARDDDPPAERELYFIYLLPLGRRG